ncbi:MAG: CoA ester lyase [Salinibacterium sp.]|nr:CoA ester lyase [Salinibacterium sp.]
MTFDLGPALLFCPADRPERYAKAAERADAVILDLEDAVAPRDKVAARETMLRHPADPDRTIVRINHAGTDDHELDLEAIDSTDYRYVMLAKTAGVRDLDRLEDYEVIALCETAAGIVNAPAIAAVRCVVGLMWGAEDLVASLGGSSSRSADGRYRGVAAQARSSVLLAAGAHGKAAIDSVFLDIPDLDGLSAEATDAAAVGFTATACIHPNQVATIRAAYAPTVDELDFARDVLAAAEGERGVFAFRGRMIDEPMLAHARTVLSRAR